MALVVLQRKDGRHAGAVPNFLEVGGRHRTSTDDDPWCDLTPVEGPCPHVQPFCISYVSSQLRVGTANHKGQLTEREFQSQEEGAVAGALVTARV